MSVREQIAKEFVEDIDIIKNHGEDILESYFDTMMKDRDAEDTDTTKKTNPDSIKQEDTKKNKCPFDRYKLSMLVDLIQPMTLQVPVPGIMQSL